MGRDYLVFVPHFLLHSDRTEKPVLFLWGLQSVAKERSLVQMDKSHRLCGLGKVCCSSVHQSRVNSTKSLAFWRGYSLCALFCSQKALGDLTAAEINCLPLLLFWAMRVSIFMAGLVSESWLTSGLFSDPCGASPWQTPCSYTANVLMSFCYCGWGLLPTTLKRPYAAADFFSEYLCTADVAWKLEWRALVLVLRVRLSALTHSSVH